MRRLRAQNPCTFPAMSKDWWAQLNQALNAEETLQVLSKDPVDQDDRSMREGMAIL